MTTNAPSLVATLQPIFQRNELILSSDRPELSLPMPTPVDRRATMTEDDGAQGSTLVLGRVSCIASIDSHLSRRVCKLFWVLTNTSEKEKDEKHDDNDNIDNNITMVLKATGWRDDSVFFVNGTKFTGHEETVIHDGDVLALFQSSSGRLGYKYKVSLAPAVATTSGAQSPTMPAPVEAIHNQANATSLAPPRDDAHSRKRNAEVLLENTIELEAKQTVFDLKLEDTASAVTSAASAVNAAMTAHCTVDDELTCPMCLELQVQSTLCAPCGHTFCNHCILSATQCPSCRARITSKLHCRTIDNVIVTLLTQQSHLFDPEDVQYFHERQQQYQKNGSINVRLSVDQSKRRRRRRRDTAATANASIDLTSGSTADQAIMID